MWTGQRGTEWPEGREGREGARQCLWSAPWRPGRCHLRRRAGAGSRRRGSGARTQRRPTWAAGRRAACSGPSAATRRRRGRSAPPAVGLRAPPASARRPGPADRRPDRSQTTAISGEKRPLFLSRDALSWGQRGGAAPAPPDRLGSEAQMRPAAWKCRGLGCDFDTSGETVQITVFGGGTVALGRPGRSHVLLSQGS